MFSAWDIKHSLSLNNLVFWERKQEILKEGGWLLNKIPSYFLSNYIKAKYLKGEEKTLQYLFYFPNV